MRFTVKDVKQTIRSPWFVEVLVRIALTVACLLLEIVRPFHRTIKHEELWLCKNPMLPDTVPTWLLIVICVAVPSAFFIVQYFSTKDGNDFAQAALGLSLAALLGWLINSILKVAIGRPRPDFYERCFGEENAFLVLQCTGDPDVIEEGLKSFPSGHSGWMFSCFGFLSLYLSGKLQCFMPSGRGQAWRICVVIAPLLAATVTGISRIQDNKHHWEDVFVGGFLGFVTAVVCYYQYFPSPFSTASDPGLVLPISSSRTNLRRLKHSESDT